VLLSAVAEASVLQVSNATAFGAGAALWAIRNGLDGVEFNISSLASGSLVRPESRGYSMDHLRPLPAYTYPSARAGFIAPGMSAAQVSTWITTAANAARSVLGVGTCQSGPIISHVMPPYYFGRVGGGGLNRWPGSTGGYSGIYGALTDASKPAADWFVLTYYNRESAAVFSWRP
jgi:hypothetical protein